MKVRIFTIVLMCASLFMSTQVSAQLLFEEAFDYPMENGDTIVASGETVNPITGWHNQNNRPRYCLIADSLTYPSYALSGIGKGMTIEKHNGQEIQKPFPESITDGTFYLAFMLNTSSCGSGDPFIRLLNASNTTIEADFRARRNSSKDSVQFGTDGVYSDVSFAWGVTHLMVLKYTFAGTNGSTSDSVAIFVNPDLSTEPSDDMALVKKENGTSADISILRFRCKGNSVQAVVDGIAVARNWDDLVIKTVDDDVEVASVSADFMSVSYESLQFDLVDGTDDIYMAHDSIAYGDNDVTINAMTVAPLANVSYTKQTVNPAPGESDTAVWVVTAEDNVTKKTYKAVVARSFYQCKTGFLAKGAGAKPASWSVAGWTYASDSKGNGGLYPGESIFRLSDKDDAEAGALITSKFSQVGTLSFSGKFSVSDSTETLIVLTSIDDGTTWDTVKVYSPLDGEIPAYAGESSADSLGRVSLSINKKDVMIRFQYFQPNTDGDLDDPQRTAIDDISCNAADYVNAPAGLETNELSEASFMIYPNPASDFIQIKGNVTNVSIYSLSGQMLKQTTQVESINISDLKSGIYLVKADNQIKQLIVK